jgi:branched-chain amino acid transport system permease protein
MMTPAIALGSWEINSTDQAVPLFALWALAIAALTLWISRAPLGRLLRAIREDEGAVESVGKPVVGPKILIFALSAAIAGLTGAFAVGYLRFIAPATYSLDLSILVAACVVLGGPGNILGGIIAGVAIGLLRPLLENSGFLSADTAIPLQSVIFGMVLVLGILLRPQGIIPELTRRLPKPAKGANSSAPVIGDTKPRNFQPAQGTPAKLSVRGLSKKFGGLQAVEQVDLDLFPGEIVALIGPNGAGKTTIFSLITGALSPDEGKVTLDGKSLSGSTPSATARSGMVRYFQSVRTFPNLSALDNVALAVPRQIGESLKDVLFRPFAMRSSMARVRDIALQQLKIVGCSDYAQDRVSDLPYGQQKLVALARILATGADVLLLDEPVSGVDPRAAEGVISIVRQLADSGKTICIVEHSLHIVEQLADRIVFLDSGRVIAQGSVREITGRDDLVSLYFGT